MIAELRSFHAVLCNRCKQPIPVSAKVVSLRDELQHEDSDAPNGFTARCRLCEQESVYSIRDVKRFDGEPPKRIARTRVAGV